MLPALGKLKLKRVIDLLNHFPRSYNTRCLIKDLKAGMHASITGTVQSAQNKATKRRRMKLTEVVVSDGTGAITALFFSQPWLLDRFKPGVKVRMSGAVD